MRGDHQGRQFSEEAREAQGCQGLRREASHVHFSDAQPFAPADGFAVRLACTLGLALDRMFVPSLVRAFLSLVGLSACFAATAGGLCADTEETAFSCRFKSKTAAICALPNRDGRFTYIQYRFGGTAIEIAIPSKDPFDLSQITGQVFSGAHGGAEEIVFANGEYIYRIQTSWDMRNDKYNAAEIQVAKNNEIISRFECKPTVSLGRDDQGLRRLITASGMKQLQ